MEKAINPLLRFTRERVIRRNVIENGGSALLALLLSFFIWVAAVTEQNPAREDIFPADLPIEIINRPSTLVLFQPFERTARVRIRAPQASWERMQSSGIRAFSDMQGATAGLREFDVQVKFGDPDVTLLAVDPPRVSLRLEELREKTFSVRLNVSDNPAVGFVVGTPQSTPSTVQVSGAQSRVDQVTEVGAAVQLRGDKTTVEREVALVARDAQGNALSAIRLVPSTVVVKVPIEQRLGFKDVSVRVVTKGNVASGYWLSNIVVEPNTVTLVGSPARLDEVGGFISTESIDVRDAKTGFLRRANIQLPDGVSTVGNTQSVLVTIDIAAITGGQTVQRKATVRGLDNAQKVALSPDTVDVILSGPLPVLQALKLEDVQVILDVATKGPGKYKITPIVIKPDSLKVESIVPDTIEVVISK